MRNRLVRRKANLCNRPVFRLRSSEVASTSNVNRPLKHQVAILRGCFNLAGYRVRTVACALARLDRLIESDAPGMALDMRTIWQRQSLSPALIAGPFRDQAFAFLSQLGVAA